MLRSRILPPLLALAACSLFPACLISSDNKVEQRGQYVGPETLARIEPGQTMSFVVALLGEPTRKTQLDDGGAIWRWSYSQVKTSATGVIFVVGTKSSIEAHGMAIVEFQDGLVKRAWRE